MKKFFNIFKRQYLIHVVEPDFKYIKKNINLKTIPHKGSKIYFSENIIYDVIDIIHYHDKRQETIWIIVIPHTKESQIDAVLNFTFQEE